eukprot:766657-Hanusia_phi.AAC.2
MDESACNRRRMGGNRLAHEVLASGSGHSHWKQSRLKSWYVKIFMHNQCPRQHGRRHAEQKEEKGRREEGGGREQGEKSERARVAVSLSHGGTEVEERRRDRTMWIGRPRAATMLPEAEAIPINLAPNISCPPVSALHSLHKQLWTADWREEACGIGSAFAHKSHSKNSATAAYPHEQPNAPNPSMAITEFYFCPSALHLSSMFSSNPTCARISFRSLHKFQCIYSLSLVLSFTSHFLYPGRYCSLGSLLHNV